MTPRNLSRFTAVLAGLLIAAASLAQQASSPQRTSVLGPRANSPSQVIGTPNFGSATLSYIRFQGIADFYPYTSVSGYASSGSLRWATTALYGMEAPLRVPSGAIIDYLEFDFCDTNASSDISLSLIDCDPLTGGCSAVTTVGSTGSPGCTSASVGSLNYTVVNSTHAISLEGIGAIGDGTVGILSAVVGYRLQVSPAPAVATFPNDVPTTHPFFRFIEALATAGITGGTGPGEFQPDSPVTRGQMAVFLSLALGLNFPN